MFNPMVDFTLIREIVGWMAEWYGFIRGAYVIPVWHGSWVFISILGFHSQAGPYVIIFTQPSPNQIKAFPKGQKRGKLQIKLPNQFHLLSSAFKQSDKTAYTFGAQSKSFHALTVWHFHNHLDA